MLYVQCMYGKTDRDFYFDLKNVPYFTMLRNIFYLF